MSGERRKQRMKAQRIVQGRRERYFKSAHHLG
jgi:hypothetical protein